MTPAPALRLKERGATRWCSERFYNRLATVGEVVVEQEAAVTKPLRPQLGLEGA